MTRVLILVFFIRQLYLGYRSIFWAGILEEKEGRGLRC